jgi:hypothetical protein
MHYRILSQTTREPLDALALHVLARAYSAAWQHIHRSAPLHQHHIPSLDLLIDFLPAGDRSKIFPRQADRRSNHET